MSGSLMDILNQQSGAENPTAMGLLGAAGGFAQAAMPSRMPVPFGAALGFAGAAAGQGMGQAYKTQAEHQAAIAAAVNNQRAGMLMDWYKNRFRQGGAGGGGASGGNGASSPGGGATDANGNYLLSPQDLVDRGDLAMATNQDRAAAQLYGMPNTMAGGPGYAMAPNGTAFPVPGGGRDPRTLFNASRAEAGGKVEPALQTKAGEKQIDINGAYPLAVATAGGTAFGNAPYQEPITLEGPDGAGGTRKYSIPRPAWGAQNGAGGGAPQAGLIPPQAFAQRIDRFESGGDPNAKNPNSTAGGSSQFLDSTWLPLARQTIPQTQGMTDQQVLALRSNPGVSQQMTVAYARQNAPVLQAAGFPPTGQNLALAHRFGPSGAVSILSSDPSMPLARVLPPEVMQANPDLAKQTVGGIVGATGMRHGFAQVDLGASPRGPSAIPGAIPGPPVMTPEQTKASEGYGTQSDSIIKAGAQAPIGLQRLEVINTAAQQFRPGMSGDERLAAGRGMVDALQALGISPPKWMLDGVTGGETINKEGGYLAAEMTRALGSREAASVFNQIKSIQPNISMSQGGFQVITNSIRQGLMRDQDLSTYREKWVADPSHNGSVAGMTDAFEQSHPVEAYASRVVPYPVPKPNALKPNVIYKAPNGNLALWDGTHFQPVPAGG